jgi:5-methylcytosine-specific restriction endonuclease McrA
VPRRRDAAGRLPWSGDGRPRWAGARSTALRAAVLDRDYDAALGYAPCHWCGRPANSADHHPIPRSAGGPDTMDNLVAACLPCNISRGVQLHYERTHPPPPSRQW